MRRGESKESAGAKEYQIGWTGPGFRFSSRLTASWILMSGCAPPGGLVCSSSQCFSGVWAAGGRDGVESWPVLPPSVLRDPMRYCDLRRDLHGLGHGQESPEPSGRCRVQRSDAVLSLKGRLFWPWPSGGPSFHVIESATRPGRERCGVESQLKSWGIVSTFSASGAGGRDTRGSLSARGAVLNPHNG